jgi:hypothetical protein
MYNKIWRHQMLSKRLYLSDHQRTKCHVSLLHKRLEHFTFHASLTHVNKASAVMFKKITGVHLQVHVRSCRYNWIIQVTNYGLYL